MNARSLSSNPKKQQLENRINYYEKGDRRKRAHHLITRGAAIESIAPLTKVLSETEFYTFAEKALAAVSCGYSRRVGGADGILGGKAALPGKAAVADRIAYKNRIKLRRRQKPPPVLFIQNIPISAYVISASPPALNSTRYLSAGFTGVL